MELEVESLAKETEYLKHRIEISIGNTFRYPEASEQRVKTVGSVDVGITNCRAKGERHVCEPILFSGGRRSTRARDLKPTVGTRKECFRWRRRNNVFKGRGGQMSIKKLQPRSLILAYLSENTVWIQQSDRVSEVARTAEVPKE